MITLQSYLSGVWQAGEGEGATLFNPATEEPVARTSTRGLDLGAALEHARRLGGPALRAMSFAERGAMIGLVAQALSDAREELIEASILNAGTPRTDAKFDVDGAIATLAHYAELGRTLGDARYLVENPEGEPLTRSARFVGVHIQTPRHGVGVHVNAFNFPAWGLAEKAAVAWLAGVPVVSKPATATALTAYRCAQRIVDCGALPEGAFALVCGSAGDLLDHLGPQDLLAFTGSGQTGALFRQHDAVVRRGARLNVEADSLNASVLCPDVEPGSDTWAMFIRQTAREISQKTGQKCTATRRIFVPTSRSSGWATRPTRACVWARSPRRSSWTACERASICWSRAAPASCSGRRKTPRPSAVRPAEATTGGPRCFGPTPPPKPPPCTSTRSSVRSPR
jgi:oxepin-CoA hydrolase/3-oxo-5,6-dehydrosuberyl-CoA semialdehyde dehydrogenase